MRPVKFHGRAASLAGWLTASSPRGGLSGSALDQGHQLLASAFHKLEEKLMHQHAYCRFSN